MFRLGKDRIPDFVGQVSDTTSDVNDFGPDSIFVSANIRSHSLPDFLSDFVATVFVPIPRIELIERDLSVIVHIVVCHDGIDMSLRPLPSCKLGPADLAVTISVSSVEVDDILVLPLGILSKEIIVTVAHPFVTALDGHAGLEVGRHFVAVGVDHVPDVVDIAILEVRDLADAAVEVIFDELTISISVAKPPVPLKIAPSVLKLLLSGSAFIM